MVEQKTQRVIYCSLSEVSKHPQDHFQCTGRCFCCLGDSPSYKKEKDNIKSNLNNLNPVNLLNDHKLIRKLSIAANWTFYSFLILFLKLSANIFKKTRKHVITIYV